MFDKSELIIVRMNDSVAHDDMLAAELADDKFAREWARLAVARALAAHLIGYRSDHGMSQRALAQHLGVSQPRVVELESGEKSPTLGTLVSISEATGAEFAIGIAPVGVAPRLGASAIREAPVHVMGGAAVRVAVR